MTPPRAFWPLVWVLALLAAIKLLVFATLDPDVFWHLLVARQLLHDGIGPLLDTISYGSIRTPWTPYSWLAELLMRCLWQLDGYRATLAAHCLLLASMVVVVAHTAMQAVPRSASRAFASGGVATAASIVFIIPWFGYRPAAFAMLLLAIIALLLQRDRRLGERSRLVWGVVPLTVLATNMHLFAILCPLWVGALLAGAIWEYLRASASRYEEKRRMLRYALLLALTTMAICATPMLPGMIASARFFLQADIMASGGVIVEMQPFYRGLFGKIAATLAILLVGSIVANHRFLRAGEMLWVVLGVAMLLQCGRGAPLFALCIVPAITLCIPRASDHRLNNKAIAWLLAGAALLGLITIAAVFPSPKVSLDQWLEQHAAGTMTSMPYPTQAATFVQHHIQPVSGKIINEFTWGGYLAWRLDGKFQVLMDGRTPAYSQQFWRDAYFGDWTTRQRLLTQTPADAAILPADGSLFLEPLKQLGWREIYRDTTAIVLIPSP